MLLNERDAATSRLHRRSAQAEEARAMCGQGKAPEALPLDGWLAAKVGATPAREAIRQYQLGELNRTLARVQGFSSFYREHYARFPGRERLRQASGGVLQLDGLEQLALLPMVTEADIAGRGKAMLCAGQEELARIVTLPTSGTTGASKRLFFSAEDLAAMIEFFRYGLRGLMAEDARVLVLFPCERPDGVGDLLLRALGEMGVWAGPGPVKGGLPGAARAVRASRASFLIGHAVPILAIGRCAAALGMPLPRLEGALVTGDSAAHSILAAVEQVWNCPVYQHYGLTEAGYGMAVSCKARRGLHLREADLLLETIDPATGALADAGSHGELVLTTLTRKAMPLVRYRTGDIGQLKPGGCACGSPLLRLAEEVRRIGAEISVRGQTLTQAQFDEALFPLEGVADVEFTCRPDDESTLNIWIALPLGEREIREALRGVSALRTLSYKVMTRPAQVLPSIRKRRIETGGM